MSEPTYEEAKGYFQSSEIYWEVFVRGIWAKREAYLSDLKRNMETPNCNERADAKIIGAMMGVEDIYYDLTLPSEEKPEQ